MPVGIRRETQTRCPDGEVGDRGREMAGVAYVLEVLYVDTDAGWGEV